MSLDVYLKDKKEIVFDANITHDPDMIFSEGE